MSILKFDKPSPYITPKLINKTLLVTFTHSNGDKYRFTNFKYKMANPTISDDFVCNFENVGKNRDCVNYNCNNFNVFIKDRSWLEVCFYIDDIADMAEFKI